MLWEVTVTAKLVYDEERQLIDTIASSLSLFVVTLVITLTFSLLTTQPSLTHLYYTTGLVR